MRSQMRVEYSRAIWIMTKRFQESFKELVLCLHLMDLFICRNATEVDYIAGIVIKASQKYQVGNYGLSISYDFTTRITTGLLHGTGVMLNRNDFPAWRNCPSIEIFDLIKAVPHLWTHPMLLPTILLQHHIYRAEHFCTTQLDDRANNLQRQLGMSRASRLSGLRGPYPDPAGGRPIQETKINLHNLTGEMNTCITELIWFCQVSEWECECVHFLSRTLDEDLVLSKTREIRECIEYMTSAAVGLKSHNYRGKERLQADFNVVSAQLHQLQIVFSQPTDHFKHHSYVASSRK
jgi:hypothetical protein